MATVTAIIGAIATLFGVVGILSPVSMKSFGTRFLTPASLYAALSMRLLVGVFLVAAGPYCRSEMPWVCYTVRAIGVLAIVVAIALMLQGPARLQAKIAWWFSRSPAFQRGASLVVLLIGGFLIYAGI